MLGPEPTLEIRLGSGEAECFAGGDLEQAKVLAVDHACALDVQIDGGGAVDHGLVGQDVFHFACRHLADARPQVIVVAHVTSRRDGDFGEAHFVLAFELR